MTDKNGKTMAMLLRLLGTALILVTLYLVGDMKADIREIRNDLNNHVIELREDVNKIKGKLGIE